MRILRLIVFLILIYTLCLAAGLIFVLLRVVRKIKIKGKSNLPIRKGNVILAANHPALAETFLIPPLYFPYYLVNPFKYFPHVTADVRALKRFPPVVLFPHIFIRKQRKDISALNAMAEVLRSERKIINFIEGKTTKEGQDFLTTSRGIKIAKPRAGIGRLVRKCNSEVVPIYVSGTDKGLFSFHQIRITIGQTLDFSSFQSFPDNRETWEIIALKVAKEILVLSDQ